MLMEREEGGILPFQLEQKESGLNDGAELCFGNAEYRKRILRK